MDEGNYRKTKKEVDKLKKRNFWVLYGVEVQFQIFKFTIDTLFVENGWERAESWN